jgi:phosphate starvation-inducible PhoH-like protein
LPKSASDSPSLAPSRKLDRDLQIPPETQVVIDFDDNRGASALVGPYGQNLALVERRLGVVVDSRGNHITIAGSRDGCDAARRVLETLYAQAVQGHDLDQGEVEGAIRAVIAQGSLFEFDTKTAKSSFETVNLRKRPVRARTAAQDSYIRALKRHELVFGIGPAGTGKTWLAVAHAAQLFERKEVDRIILSRPAVEAGERLGFLPGDLREKVDPYLRPIYDALYDLMDSRIVERALQAGEIEIAPLAFMRGRTLTNAAIILDEAQNTTSMQMKMFLTRLGENSRMIITGDPSQVDLPNGQTSGLAEAARLLDGVEGIAQDCRSGRQPASLDAKIRSEKRAGSDFGAQTKFRSDGAHCPSHDRGSRRRRRLAERARRRGSDPARYRDRGRDGRCRYGRGRARGHADRRFRHPHPEQQLARHRQADQRAVVSGAAADRRKRGGRRAAHARRHRDRL